MAVMQFKLLKKVNKKVQDVTGYKVSDKTMGKCKQK